MNRRVAGIALAQLALVVGLGLVVGRTSIPLGVRGEWAWSRLEIAPGGRPGVAEFAPGLLGLVAYAGLAAALVRWVGPGGPLRSTAAVGLLTAGAIGVQVALTTAAPSGYGLAKWTTIGLRASSGYLDVAKSQVGDAATFWRDYPAWIARQDALHVGTHPPGLFLASRGALVLMRSNPGLARAIDEEMPGSASAGMRLILGPIPREERAAIALIGGVTLLLCAVTVVPLYALARASGLDPSSSIAVAALWPVLPAAILFQPTADSAFPALATAAVAGAAGRGRVAAIAAGVGLAVGMQFSLAFLAVGLVAAIVALAARDRPTLVRVARIALIGVGFAATTGLGWAASGANPLRIWWWNQRNHARFYAEYPRSYLAWVAVNPLELAVAIGLPTAILILARSRRRPPAATLATLSVLAILTLSGRSLSEVARLWLPLMPPLLLGAAEGPDGNGSKSAATASTVAITGLQVVVLENLIQVVYSL